MWPKSHYVIPVCLFIRSEIRNSLYFCTVSLSVSFFICIYCAAADETYNICLSALYILVLSGPECPVLLGLGIDLANRKYDRYVSALDSP